MLASIARERWLRSYPELKTGAFFVRHDAYALNGIFLMGATVATNSAGKALETAREVIRSLASTPPSIAEVTGARNELLAVLGKADVDDANSELWLDADAFEIKHPVEPSRRVSDLAPADAQRIAAKLFREAANATIAVGNAAQLSAQLTGNGGAEVLGATSTTEPTPAAGTTTDAPLPKTK